MSSTCEKKKADAGVGRENSPSYDAGLLGSLPAHVVHHPLEDLVLGGSGWALMTPPNWAAGFR